DGGKTRTAAYAGPTGRDLWQPGAVIRRTINTRRSAGTGRDNRRALVGGRSLSTPGRATIGASRDTAQRGRGGGVSADGSGCCPPPAGKVARTAGGDEPESVVAAAGQACRGIRPAGADLWLVHRGV